MEQKKEIHIVFQVLNFVFSDLSNHLLPIEKLFLIALSKHKGPKGIYPSGTTLAKELNVTNRYIREIVASLQAKNIIQVDRKQGKSNRFDFLFLSTTPEPQFLGSETSTPEPQFLPPRNCSSYHPGTTVPPININNHYKRNNTERGRKKRASSLSVSFLPNEENTILAQDLRINISEELDSFNKRHKGDKTQYEFGRWLKQAKEYQTRKSGVKGSSGVNGNNAWVPPQPKEWVRNQLTETEINEKKRREELRKRLDAEAGTIEPPAVSVIQQLREHSQKQGALSNGTGNKDSGNYNGGRTISSKN